MAREASKAGSSTATGEVRLEGNADKLDTALLATEKRVGLLTQKIAGLAAEQGKYAATSTRVTAAYDRFDAALARSNTGVAKATAGAHNLTSTYNRLGFAAHQLVGGTASFNTALQGVLGTLGPYGIAIGAAAGLLFHFVEGEMAAAEATRKATAALKEKRIEAAKQSKADYFEKVVLPEQRRAAEERTAVKALRETEIFLEEEAALARRDVRLSESAADSAITKKQLSDVLSAQAVARAEVLKAEADIARSVEDMDEAIRLDREAEKVLRADRIRMIDDVEKADKDHHRAKKQRRADELTEDEMAFKREVERIKYREQLFADMSKRVQGYIKRDREAQFDALDAEFERAMKQYAQLSEFRPKAALASQLSDIETQEATGQIDKLEAIEMERQARLAYLEQTRAATETTFEAEQRIEQARQINHDAEMARIAEETQKRNEQIAAGQRFATSVITSMVSIGDARHQAIRAAKLQGKTDAEAARAGKIAALEQAAGSLRALRDFAIVKAISETAAGFGALGVTWGIPNPAAINHFASAAAWGIVAGGAGLGARGLEGRADAMAGQGGAGGQAFGPGGNAGGGANSPRSGTMQPGSDSPIPGSPPPTQRNTTVTGHNFAGATFNLYGAGGRAEFIRQIDEDLNQHDHSRKARRTG